VSRTDRPVRARARLAAWRRRAIAVVVVIAWAAPASAGAPDDAAKVAPGIAVQVSGVNRFATAIEIARLHDVGAEEVVLVVADEPAVAMIAAPLAVGLDALVLLTGRDALPVETREAIEAAGASRATLIGDPGRISGDVVAELDELGLAVRRIDGEGPTGMAAAVADAMEEPRSVYLAAVDADDPVEGWAEVLVAAVLAARSQAPLLLVEDGRIDEVTARAITALAPSTVIAVGDGLPRSAARSLARLEVDVTRLPGAAVQLATEIAAEAEGTRRGPVFIASDGAPADALVLPSVVAGTGGALLLVEASTEDDVPADPERDDAIDQFELAFDGVRVTTDAELPGDASGLLVLVGGGIGERDGEAIIEAAGVRRDLVKVDPMIRSGGGDVLVLVLGVVIGIGSIGRRVGMVVTGRARRGPPGGGTGGGPDQGDEEDRRR
jgi:putative cell wall-binding protein